MQDRARDSHGTIAGIAQSPEFTSSSLLPPPTIHCSTKSATESSSFTKNDEIILGARSLSGDEGRARSPEEPVEDSRYFSLLELLETERSYLESLRILVKVYFQALPSLNLLTAEEIENVRRNGEALLSLHEKIAARIIQAEEETSWGERDIVGRAERDGMVRAIVGKVAVVFSNFLPSFELYADFCSKHFEALSIIRGIENRPEWELLERQCSFHATNRSNTASGDSTPIATQSPRVSTLGSKASFNFDNNSTNSLPCTNRNLSTSTSMSSLLTPSIQASKLRFQDYAIKPIQMICRYPLMLGQVLKHWGDLPERLEVLRAWDGLRTMAEEVDDAKRRREGELRTRLVAARLEFQSSINTAFCDILGPTLLVGSLHVLHRWSVSDQIKTKYYGCFLYNSHIVMVKVKKREIYEPREWLPLRMVEIRDILDSEGILPFSIRLLYHQDQHFDLAATCAAEKIVWLEALITAQNVARQVWEQQPRTLDGKNTLFDGNTISSIPSVHSLSSSPTTPMTGTPVTSNILKRHSRTQSSASLSAALDGYQRDQDPSGVYDYLTLSSAATSPISTTTIPLLPVPAKTRVSISQKLTIDSRLQDVFSQSLLAARAQGIRENERALLRTQRSRTISNPKRSSSTVESLSRISLKDMRRMSEPRRARETIEVDQNGFVLDRLVGTSTQSQSSKVLVKRSKTLASPTKRKDLAPLDTKMSARLVRGSPGFPILRGSGPSTFAVVPSPIQSTALDVPLSAEGISLASPSESTTSVDRNNSVSSNNSSITTTASSPYFQPMQTVGLESPNSSLACSPSRECFELSPAPVNAIDVVPQRWSATEAGPRQSNRFGRRATSTSGTERPQGLTRSSTVNYFKTRVKSSPMLSSYFGSQPIQLSPSLIEPIIEPILPRPSTPIYDALSSPQTSPVIDRVAPIPRRATEPILKPTRRNSLRAIMSKLSITPMKEN